MNEERFKKILNYAKWISLFFLIFEIIIFATKLSTSNMKTSLIVAKTIDIAVLLGIVIGCKNRKIFGPICGVIKSILMIISFSILDFLFGIVFLIEFIDLIKYMKKNLSEKR